MGKQIVNIAFPEITFSGGNIALTTIVDFDPKIDDPGKAVMTMNRSRRPIGMQHGIPSFKFSLTVVLPVGDREVPWEELALSKEQFKFTYQESEGGFRWTFVDAWVDSMDKTFKPNGETECKIECQALDHRPAAANQ